MVSRGGATVPPRSTTPMIPALRTSSPFASLVMATFSRPERKVIDLLAIATPSEVGNYKISDSRQLPVSAWIGVAWWK